MHKNIQICISNNCSTDNTEEVVQEAKKYFPVKYNKNYRNLGMARNILKVVEMADGEYVWVIGDDDLLMPDSLGRAISLLCEHDHVDYFYVNSNILSSDYVLSCKRPFELTDLPKKMELFSPKKNNEELRFIELIDPRISFDFLGGIFLSIFRRENWLESVNVLNKEALLSERTFSHFDNTFPHIKIFAHAFANSNAYFYSEPLSVCVSGVREWGEMYPLIKSVRLIEALDIYKENGLPILKYLYCRNFALNTFATDFARMLIKPNKSGFKYINPLRVICSNLVFPNFYLSFISPFFRKKLWIKVFQIRYKFSWLMKRTRNE